MDPRQKGDAAHEKTESRYIVRIASKDLNGTLPICRALTGVKGLGQRMGRTVAIAFEKETGIPYDSQLGKLDEAQSKKLEDVVMHPAKYKIPAWSQNRRRDFETGEDSHLVMTDLDFSYRKDFQRLNEIKSYRGLRRSWGLPVRGQRTKSTHRGKGAVVGVLRKEVAQAQQPAKGVAAKEEKKK